MRIILRSKDSVTSIVLFIFNIYRDYTGKCSIPLEKLLAFMNQFGKSETATRMGLSRMVKSGILTNEQVNKKPCYKLTDFGLENINLWNKGISRFFERFVRRHQKWDGNWYAVTFLEFNRSDKEAQPFIDEIVEMGLREINKNVWICPYQLSDEVDELTSQHKIKYFELFSGNARYNFPSDELLNDVFEVEAIRKRYNEFSELIKSIKQKLSELERDRGRYLPMLFRLGWNFYDIAVSDPALPKELLKKWEGDQVVEDFKKMRETLYDNVVQYIDES